MNFNFSDLATPLSDRFNKNIDGFIEDIKKILHFDDKSGADVSHYPEKDRNGFITKVVLERNFSGSRGSGRLFEFYPNVFGYFDFKLIDLATNEIIEHKDNSPFHFFADVSSRDGLSLVKKFFKVE